jgi:hypothetical protein
LFFGFPLEAPGGPLADVVVSAEIGSDRLQSDVDPRCLGEVIGQEAGGPVGSGHADVVGIEIDHAEEFGFPGGGHLAGGARSLAARNGVAAACEEAVEDAGDGIVAAQQQGSNLGRSEPLVGKENHLEAQPGLGVVGLVEAASNLGEEGFTGPLV